MFKHHQGEKVIPLHIATKNFIHEKVPLHPNSNNQTICNGVCMPIVKGKYFVLSSFYKKIFFSRCSKTHICTFIWSLMWCFLTPFLHLIFIISDGLFESKIISTSFFPKKLCMVSYFLMFIIYLPSDKAISPTTLESKPWILSKYNLHIEI
jgi:hypothetical protein